MSNENIDELKKIYIDYYHDVPVQKYAALFIGRDEDTIIRWRNEDQDFADAVKKARAEWIRKKVIATKAEYALERLEKAVFSPKVSIDIHEAEKPEPVRNKAMADAFTKFLMEYTKTEEYAESVGQGDEWRKMEGEATKGIHEAEEESLTENIKAWQVLE